MAKFKVGQRVVRIGNSTSLTIGTAYYVLFADQHGQIQVGKAQRDHPINGGELYLEEYFKAADACGPARTDRDVRLLLCSK